MKRIYSNLKSNGRQKYLLNKYINCNISYASVSIKFTLLITVIFGMCTSQDSKHIYYKEIKCTAVASEPGDGTDTTGGGPNEENNKEKEERRAEASDSEACEQEDKVTENVNTMREDEKTTAVEEKEDVTGHMSKEQNNETGVNKEGNEGNNESPTKENNINKADNICEGEGKLKETKGGKLGNNSESQTEQTEDKDKNEIKKNKDHVQDKVKNPSRKSGTTSLSALRAPMKSSVCPRAAQPSARKDAMAKFQKDQ